MGLRDVGLRDVGLGDRIVSMQGGLETVKNIVGSYGGLSW